MKVALGRGLCSVPMLALLDVPVGVLSSASIVLLCLSCTDSRFGQRNWW